MQELSPILAWPVSNWRLYLYRMPDGTILADDGTKKLVATVEEIESWIARREKLEMADGGYWEELDALSTEARSFDHLLNPKGIEALRKVLPVRREKSHVVADESISLPSRLRAAAES